MKRAEFWVIVSLIVVLMGLILSMNARMATKDDITALKVDMTSLKAEIDRVETALKAEIKEVRDLLISHIMASHQGHSHGKPVAKNLEAGKSQKPLQNLPQEKSPQDHAQSSPVAKKAQ